ncbi:MAG TPA: HlyD family secretion protein [Oceanospirillales bacterium]|nr:HlyD family secretion protein [Oceanospirillales bacterium]
MKKILKKLPILPIIVLTSVAIVIIAVKIKAPIAHEELGYPAKAVEVIKAKKIPFRARVMAFGNVEPAILMKAKAEVSGKIVYIHPKLKQGASLTKGTVVLRIEPTTYEISLNQSKAGLAGSKSSLAQLVAEEKSAKGALKIAQEKLDFERKELKRLQAMWDKKLIARTTLDAEEKNVLSLAQQVQDIEGKLSAFASRKATVAAQIKQSESLVNKGKDSLGRTEITLPFDARIGQVFVENGEFTAIGAALFEALGVQAVEINAQLPLKQFRALVAGIFDTENTSLSLQNPEIMQAAIKNLKLEARVRLVGNISDQSEWSGELIRLSESVDPSRDTLGLVVAVNNPYDRVIPGVRPPLLKGMYTSVEFFAPSKDTMVIPRKAVHQGRVYVALENNTVDIRPVEIAYSQGDLVVIKNGLKDGENIIISDMIPVMQGLPIIQMMAENYANKLRKEAAGDK